MGQRGDGLVHVVLVEDDADVSEGSGLVLRVVDLRSGVERSRTPIAGSSLQLLGAAPDGTILVATTAGRPSGLHP